MGHILPVWQRFRGGKGVATGGGVFAALSPIVFAGAIALWFLLSRVTRKASVASIVTVGLLPVGVGLVRQEAWEIIATAAMCLLVMSRHLGNIRRLATRREHALS